MISALRLFITNLPPMFVLHKLPPFYLAWGVAVPVILLLLVRLVRTRGLRSYSGASS